MKTLSVLLVAGSLLGIAQLAHARTRWTVEELKVAQTAALDTFKANEGEEAFANIWSFGIEKNVQETAGKAKIVYKVGGVKKEVSLFCHEHEPGEIDCH